MASLITVRLDKGSSPSLGFRLQGGKDFGTPLVIQKVNGGSPAERAGLIAGDSVIKINNTDVFNLRHKDAQDVILRAGPSFEVTVQRGGTTWKPSVTPIGTFPSQNKAAPLSPVTKTSLAANKKENIGAIGTGHNVSAKPFQVNGVNGSGPKVVNNQYNSPLKLYSEESIAETLSAQTEVLSTGALGVNFKKNEKNYDATNSAVYRMLQEAENEPKTPDPVVRSEFYATHSHAIGGNRQVTTSRSNTPLDNRPGESPNLGSPPNQEGVTKCTDCDRVIVGVFVRIKDKNLHVECFKCSTCGTSLKNVGYYNINNKLYCDVHAKLAARNNPPAPNLVPVTVPSGGKTPTGTVSSPSFPSPSPLSPRSSNIAPPFQATGPKPFSSVSAPTYNTLPRAAPAKAPLSPVASTPAPSFTAPSYSPASSTGRSVQNIVWPPPHEEPELPTACPIYIPPETHIHVIPKSSKKAEEEQEEKEGYFEDDYIEYFEDLHINQYQQNHNMSEDVCSITGRRKSATECIETISEKLQTQRLVENVVKKIPVVVPSVDQDIYIETCSTISSESCDLKRLSDLNPKEKPLMPPSMKSDNAVPQRWESPMLKALKVGSEADKENADPFTQIPSRYSASPLASALAVAPSEPFNPNSGITLQPVPLPEETVPYFPPEHPVLPEPEEPKPTRGVDKFGKIGKPPLEAPTESKPIRRRKIGKDPTDEFFKDLPKPEKKLSMRDALTTASDRPYSPFVYESVVTIEEQRNAEEEKYKIDKSKLQRPLKPTTLPASFKPPHLEEKPNPSTYPLYKEIKIETSEQTCQEAKETKQTEVVQKQTIVQPDIQLAQEEMEKAGCYPIFKGFSCSFENKSEHSQFKIEISTSPPLIEKHQTKEVKQLQQEEVKTETVTTEKTSKTLEKAEQKQVVAKQAEEIVYKKPIPLSSALHKPGNLPQYQVNISENAEAEIMIMEKKEAAQQRLEQKKLEQKEMQKSETVQPVPLPTEPMKKPIITIQPGDAPPQPESSFIPVSADRPASTTFSPRPRPLTPSMINKPPPAIPYYQQNLVPYQCPAPHINMLDPATPNVSRSPSPCPGGRRSPSPFLSATASATLRPQSPAAGPPPNPLKAPAPPPTPRDSRMHQAQEKVTNFIPQYKSKRDIYERDRALEIAEAGGTTQMYSSQATTKNIQPALQGSNVVEVCSKSGESSIVTDARNEEGYQKRSVEMKAKEVEDMQRAELICKHTEKGTESTAISEQSHAEHSEQLRKSETKSVEQSGGVQIQRKKTVTEEFEHTQKSSVIQIEKNVTSQSFRNVANVEAEASSSLHITCPQPIHSPFLKNTQAIKPAPAKSQSKCDSCPKSCSNCPQKCNKTNTECNQACRIPRAAQVPQANLPKPIQVPKVPKPAFDPGSSRKPNTNKSNIPVPNAGSTGGRQAGAIGVAPKRGRGVLNAAAIGGTRVPLCGSCHSQIRGPFITALGKIWCPEHFICATPSCRRQLHDLGFVEEQGQLYCEYCFEQYLAPPCSKCASKIKGDCLKAIGKNFHPECFNCVYCGKLFGNNPFFLEDGNPYCEADWNELFTTKCFACGFPVEAGDRWVEALNNNYHSQCFNCTMCKKNLEGQSFFAKGGRPFCKNHAR